MNSLDRLAHVRCFLLDMDGTIYLGDQLIDGALRFLDVLRDQGKNFLFVTNNSSKNSSEYMAKLTRLGITAQERQVLTSGAATALYLSRVAPGARVYVVGTPALEADFESRGFILTPSAEAELAVLGFDTTVTYAKLWGLCDMARAGLPYYATHPDNICPTDTSVMPDIGAMIAFVHTVTERMPDLIVGKPNSIMADTAVELSGVPREALCMVGDRLYTDIAMGTENNILTALVLSGETSVAHLPDAPFRPDYVFANLGELADALLTLQAS
jgi:4-nitrophenyl phosphatase